MTDLSALVEDAARALSASQLYGTAWDRLGDGAKETMRKNARAALLAFHNPDSEAGKALVKCVARGMCADLGLHADDWTEDSTGERIHVWEREAGTARAAITAIARALSEQRA